MKEKTIRARIVSGTNGNLLLLGRCRRGHLGRTLGVETGRGVARARQCAKYKQVTQVVTNRVRGMVKLANFSKEAVGVAKFKQEWPVVSNR